MKADYNLESMDKNGLASLGRTVDEEIKKLLFFKKQILDRYAGGVTTLLGVRCKFVYIYIFSKKILYFKTPDLDDMSILNNKNKLLLYTEKKSVFDEVEIDSNLGMINTSGLDKNYIVLKKDEKKIYGTQYYTFTVRLFYEGDTKTVLGLPLSEIPVYDFD